MNKQHIFTPKSVVAIIQNSNCHAFSPIQGFVEGASGIVTNPFQGAKKEGAKGFFKGVGRGLVGAVAKPTAGVIDFASGTLEGIKR